MSLAQEGDQAAVTPPSEEVTFFAYDQPILESGEYTIAVTQNVSIGANIINPTLSKMIFVAGDRFIIEPKQVFRQFPLLGTTGNYAGVMPHIALTRGTLPWERSGVQLSDGTTPVPWMWLVVYDDADLVAGKLKKLTDQTLAAVFAKVQNQENVTVNSTGTLIPETLTLEPGETGENTTVNLLQFSTPFLKAVFPSNQELTLLSSMRQNTTGNEVTEHAIVIANRLPQPGVKSYACLLSLEGRLQSSAGKNQPTNLKNAPTEGMTSFVSLAEWSFTALGDTCYQVTSVGQTKLNALVAKNSSLSTIAGEISTTNFPDFYTNQAAFIAALVASNITQSTWNGLSTAIQNSILNCFEVSGHSFEQLLTNVSAGPLVFPEVDAGNITDPNAQTYLESGAVPFPHQLHNGGSTVSWYRSPLSPSSSPDGQQIPSPVLSSDQLLRFDSNLNMLDVSYAAAWELGKLLTLNNTTVSEDLLLWKRQQKWKNNESKASSAQIIGNTASTSVTKEDVAVKAWLTALTQLTSIPFNYLVPFENMLPDESIRFFTLDSAWMSCLLDGALSMGRVSSFDAASDANTLTHFGVPLSTSYSGFILRSEAVTGWPGFEVTANPGDEPLALFQRTQLAPNMVLFLFEGALSSVDIHLKAESLHFGFDVVYDDSATPSFEKLGAVQYINSKWQYATYATAITPTIDTNRIVDVASLAQSFNTQAGLTNNSAGFAIGAIAGVPNIIFSITPPQPTALASEVKHPKPFIVRIEKGLSKVESNIKYTEQHLFDKLKKGLDKPGGEKPSEEEWESDEGA